MAESEQPIDQPFVTPIGTSAPAAFEHVAAIESLNDPVADLVSLVADTLYSLGVNDGYAGQIVDAAEHQIDLYWKGNLPNVVSTYLETAHALGVDVNVHADAAMSRIEELAAASEVIGSSFVESAAISSVSANPDGTGITVQMIGAAPSTTVRAGVASAAGLDASAITYETNMGKVVLQAGSRPNDVAPWKGGGRIVVGTQGCSSGFAVLSGTNGRLLSAAHCKVSGSPGVSDGAGQTIANASGVAVNNSIDSMSIDPVASPATIARVFTGAWNSSTVATVKNWAANYVGDPVCSSGASTGTHCGTVINDATAFPGHTGTWYIRTRANSGAFSGVGDSGGPVYKTVTGGVQARGTVIGGYDNTAVTCGAHATDMNTAPCTRESLYLPISVALNTWGYSLEVG